MSTIKKIITILLVISFHFVSSQETKWNQNSAILINPKEALISYYSVSKDTCKISIGIYINGFESKNKRYKIISKHKKGIKKRNEYHELPTFSINFLSLTKPEKLNSLEGVDYILTKEFNVNNQIPNPLYFIVKQKDGTYLKWKTSVMPKE